VLALALALAGLVRPVTSAPDAPKPDLSSPEAAVRSFVLASNRLEAEAALCVQGARIDPVLLEWAKEARKQPEIRFQLTVLQVKAEVTGDTAVAEVSTEVVAGGPLKMQDTLKLRREGVEWKIVPPTPGEAAAFLEQPQSGPRLLPLLVATFTQPRTMAEARIAAQGRVCQNNVKGICIGVQLTVGNSEFVFAFRPDQLMAAAKPAELEERTFHCPLDPDGPISYSFNAQLQGKSLLKIPDPDDVVMLYEGKNGVLDFRHGGKAVICLLNGRTRLVDTTEAARLRWKP
jgi:hypothetical protein